MKQSAAAPSVTPPQRPQARRLEASDVTAKADEVYQALERAGCGPQEILKVSTRLVERVTTALRQGAAAAK